MSTKKLNFNVNNESNINFCDIRTIPIDSVENKSLFNYNFNANSKVLEVLNLLLFNFK